MINSLIVSIITNNSRLTIPSLGSFMRNATNGDVLFISALKKDDGQLSKLLSESLCIDQNEAIQIVDTYAKSIIDIVNSKGVYHLDDFGDFVLDSNSLIAFVQKPKLNSNSIVEPLKQEEYPVVLPQPVSDNEVIEQIEEQHIANTVIELPINDVQVSVESEISNPVYQPSIDVLIEQQPVKNEKPIEDTECNTHSHKTLADVLSQENSVKRVFESVHPKIHNDNFETPKTINSTFLHEETPFVITENVAENPAPIKNLDSTTQINTPIEKENEVSGVLNDLISSKERKNRLAELYDSIDSTKTEVPKIALSTENVTNNIDTTPQKVDNSKNIIDSKKPNIEQKNISKPKQGTDYVMLTAIIAISLAVLVSAYYFFVRIL